MKKKLFGYHLALVILVLITVTGLILNTLYQYFSDLRTEDLRQQAHSLAEVLENDGLEAFEVLAYNSMQAIELYGETSHMMLYSARYGHSDLVYGKEMETAAEQGEAGNMIKALGAGGYWVAFALQLEDGRMLRVSDYQHSQMSLGARILLPVFILFVLAGMAIWLIAGRVTKLATEPLNNAGLEDLESSDVCRELRPMATQILDQSRQMQRKLQKQNVELRREYEKQDRMRRDFTANVSHELKTPLTSISGYAEIIRDGIVKEEDIERFAGKIYDETQRLIVLVGDILKLSQLDEGHQIQAKRGSVDLYEVCRQTVQRLQDPAKARGITFTLSGAPLFVTGVEKIIEEIVYNLCDNAIKYNEEHGLVAVSVTKRDEKVMLSVRDSGIGISPEEQERVFERFYRVDKSHSKEIGGTGLGLSIVKHGAAYHDARIEMESELGKGTEFRVLFPADGGHSQTE